MTSVIIITIVITLIFALVIAVIAITYFLDLNSDMKDTLKFLEITDWEIIQNEDEPLFFLVISSENIPQTLKTKYVGYGFGWLYKDSEKLYGYTTIIHFDKWHTESITIDDSKQFCIDNAEFVISNVIINQNKIKVIVEQSDLTDFDRIISYEIIKDDTCHLGFGGKIIEQHELRK
jgi:hypothetical protein